MHDGKVEQFDGDLEDYQQWLVDSQRQQSQQDNPAKELSGNSAQQRKDQNVAMLNSALKRSHCVSEL